jgi:hypothetical protein
MAAFAKPGRESCTSFFFRVRERARLRGHFAIRTVRDAIAELFEKEHLGS